MELIVDGWFHERNKLWPGQCMSLKVKEILYHGKSKYQDVLVFESTHHGNVLVLDGVIQCTERDEFSYQEMIAHVPLFSHPNPQHVLIIGGGDGGVVREVLKHDCVQTLTQCEIDEDVIDISKKYLPKMASAYDNPKLTTHVGDGFKFMEGHPGCYDVIITDSSDPDGPAETLFQEEYYQLMKKALKPNGIICSQGECLWLHLDLIRTMKDFCEKNFPKFGYSYTTIPTYPSGQIGFVLCSLNENTDFAEPERTLSEDDVLRMQLKYYNSAIHRASFVLPQFALKALYK